MLRWPARTQNKSFRTRKAFEWQDLFVACVNSKCCGQYCTGKTRKLCNTWLDELFGKVVGHFHRNRTLISLCLHLYVDRVTEVDTLFTHRTSQRYPVRSSHSPLITVGLHLICYCDVCTFPPRCFNKSTVTSYAACFLCDSSAQIWQKTCSHPSQHR